MKCPNCGSEDVDYSGKARRYGCYVCGKMFDRKKQVEAYFKEHGQADIEELMVNLKIPVEDLVDIIDDMKKEGRIVPKGGE